jgi:hypothetical protein
VPFEFLYCYWLGASGIASARTGDSDLFQRFIASLDSS